MTLDQSGAGIMSLVVVFAILSTIIVVLRFTARKDGNAYGSDDWCIIPAWLCFVGVMAVIIYGVTHNLIANQAVLDDGQGTKDFMELYLITTGLSTAILGLIRLSALFYYRRIFVTKTKPRSVFSVATIVLMVLVSIRTLVFIFIPIAVCRPSNLWDDTCFTYVYVEGMAASSFSLDTLVVIVPMPVIWTLHTTVGRKLGLTMVFLLAAAGIAASCTRMITYYLLHQNKTSSLVFTQFLYYLILETGFGLVAVNLPLLWYFFRDTTPRYILRYIRYLFGFPHDRFTDTNLLDKSSELEKSDSGIVVTQDFVVEFKSPEVVPAVKI